MQIDGELSHLGDRSALAEHLEQCRACRELRESEASTSSRLRLALVDPFHDKAALSKSILARFAVLQEGGSLELGSAEIYRLSRQARGWSRWWRVGAVAAIFLGGVWAGWQFLPGWFSPTQQRQNVVGGASGGSVSEPAIRFVWEETLEESRILPDEAGLPVRRDVERLRRRILPSQDSAREAGDFRGGVEVERIRARNVQLVTWPYR